MQLSTDKLPTINELSWLYTVTKNQTIEYIRKQRDCVDIDALYDIANQESEIDEIIDIDSYNKIIDSLEDKEKEIISLKIFANFTFKEIGQMLGMPTGTVQWKYYKSMHTLKILLGNLSLFAITSILYVKSRASSFNTKEESNNVQYEDSTSIDSTMPSINIRYYF